jgi:hypothetical protein
MPFFTFFFLAPVAAALRGRFSPSMSPQPSERSVKQRFEFDYG